MVSRGRLLEWMEESGGSEARSSWPSTRRFIRCRSGGASPTGSSPRSGRFGAWSANTGFRSRQIGPETDYYGQVSPYLMDLSEFDEEISSGRIPVLAEFVDGLEPEYWPAVTDAWPAGVATHDPSPPTD